MLNHPQKLVFFTPYGRSTMRPRSHSRHLVVNICSWDRTFRDGSQHTIRLVWISNAPGWEGRSFGSVGSSGVSEFSGDRLLVSLDGAGALRDYEWIWQDALAIRQG